MEQCWSWNGKRIQSQKGMNNKPKKNYLYFEIKIKLFYRLTQKYIGIQRTGV